MTANSEGILAYVNDQIPLMEMNPLPIPNDIQAIPIEINLRKCKWLFSPSIKHLLKMKDISLTK